MERIQSSRLIFLYLFEVIFIFANILRIGGSPPACWTEAEEILAVQKCINTSVCGPVLFNVHVHFLCQYLYIFGNIWLLLLQQFHCMLAEVSKDGHWDQRGEQGEGCKEQMFWLEALGGSGGEAEAPHTTWSSRIQGEDMWEAHGDCKLCNGCACAECPW